MGAAALETFADIIQIGKGDHYDQNRHITDLKRNAMAETAVNEVDNLQYIYDVLRAKAGISRPLLVIY